MLQFTMSMKLPSFYRVDLLIMIFFIICLPDSVSLNTKVKIVKFQNML